MPTTRPRHTITEVGPVEDALRRVREATGGANLRELIVLGADAKLEVETERRQALERRTTLRERLIARTTRPAAVDLAAAEEVRRHGWSRSDG